MAKNVNRAAGEKPVVRPDAPRRPQIEARPAPHLERRVASPPQRPAASDAARGGGAR